MKIHQVNLHSQKGKYQMHQQVRQYKVHFYIIGYWIIDYEYLSWKEIFAMSNLKKSIFIKAPMDKVVKYATNPKEWAHWYTHLSEPENLTGTGEKGTVGEFKYTIIGMNLPMTVEVKENSPSNGKHVWIGTFEGPLSGTQTFTYMEKDGGTELDVEIDYKLPGSILGKFADALIVERIQENATTATLNNLKTICEAM